MRHFFLSFISLLCFVTFALPAYANTNILFIVDASGSMKKEIDGKTRMSVAKDVLAETLADMPEEANLGLIVYGHRKAKDCSDLQLVAPIGGEDAKTIGKTIKGLNAMGETPIAESLKQAAKSFKVFKGQQNKIILVTDGKEECGGDPCAAAKELKDAGLDVVVNIVGFTLGDDDAKKLQCVTKETGGKYYSAADASGLAEALKDVQKEVAETVIVQEAKEEGFNGDILAEKNGGKLEYAPNDNWNTLNKDPKKLEGPVYSGAGVWSFKDGKAATFDQVEVLVTGASSYNLKDFEILSADELDGSYKSLGEFTVQNVKMMPEGWQGFKFPETTARFVKIIFKDGQNGHVSGNSLKLKGKIVEDSEPAEKPEETDGIDILSQKNGATLISAPNENWNTLNGKPKNFKGPTYSGEGIWSFKDGKAATFDRVGVHVDRSSQYNLKDFEVFAADELSGPYKSLGEFTVANHKVMPDGYQFFTFPETTAKFIKINFVEGQDGYVSGNMLKVIGKINEDSEAAEKQPEIDGENLIAQKNGGTLLMGKNDSWAFMNDGEEKGYAIYDGEGVWAFKDEKPAIIEAVGVLLVKKDKYNLKDFEVFVGDDGPTGDFRSVGQFTTQNVKVMPDGWQMFVFPKTEAKYVKIKTINGHEGYISGYEFSVMGKLAE